MVERQNAQTSLWKILFLNTFNTWMRNSSSLHLRNSAVNLAPSELEKFHALKYVVVYGQHDVGQGPCAETYLLNQTLFDEA